MADRVTGVPGVNAAEHSPDQRASGISRRQSIPGGELVITPVTPGAAPIKSFSRRDSKVATTDVLGSVRARVQASVSGHSNRPQLTRGTSCMGLSVTTLVPGGYAQLQFRSFSAPRLQ